jgi:hypothetical protein
MRVAQALQYSTAEGPEQLGFDPLKANDSSFDFATLMGHNDPYGPLWFPTRSIFAEERQK